jgi:hypothetical protein
VSGGRPWEHAEDRALAWRGADKARKADTPVQPWRLGNRAHEERSLSPDGGPERRHNEEEESVFPVIRGLVGRQQNGEVRRCGERS